MMTPDMYKEIINTIRETPRLRDVRQRLGEKFPTVEKLTLGSILSNFVQRKMKVNHKNHNTTTKIQEYYQSYKTSIEKKEESGIILRLSDTIDICPVLVARFILEGYLREKEEINSKEESNKIENSEIGSETAATVKKWRFNRSDLSRLLRFTDQIEDAELAYETHLCTVYDDHYGPFPDAIRQSIGLQYERLLKDQLLELKICFVDETILRQQGYDKTPDFKLEVPIGIGNRVINWIESKATFGDEETHQTYLDEQLLSYWNRFGPGLVIYWLGYMETLPYRTIPGILIRDKLPTEITFFRPGTDPIGFASNNSSSPFKKIVPRHISFQ